MNILERITILRERRHWTEYRLAEESGLPQSTISSWYRKGMLPSISSLEKVCDAFSITMSQFFADDQDCVTLTADQKQLLEKWVVLNTTQQKMLLQFLATL